MNPVKYDIALDPQAHLFKVTCQIEAPAPQQRLTCPRWLPGSYLLRNFAKHIVAFNVETPGATYQIIDTTTWEVSCPPDVTTLTVVYEVYGFDHSVRGLYLDTERAFINNSRLCLMVEGKLDAPHQITWQRPAVCHDWTMATTLPVMASSDWAHEAPDYDTLIDHPIEMGQITTCHFDVNHVPHQIAVSGAFSGDLSSLSADVKRICATHQKLFDSPAPFSEYLFLLNLVGKGYGGLEHRDSTALQATRDCLLPSPEHPKHQRYITLLGLFSHEYFHAWHVKRIQPAVFKGCDLTQEVITPLLWVFEGFTTYYDDLALARSGVISEQKYLNILAELISRYLRQPGRHQQSLADASHYAWTKFYQPDENSPNATISYYLKGALVACCLDGLIRHETRHQQSLDDVMRALWQTHEQGVTAQTMATLLSNIGGSVVAQWLPKFLYTTEPLPLEDCLSYLGVALSYHPTPDVQTLTPTNDADNITVSLGASIVSKAGHCQLQTVYRDSAAARAGLCPGDQLIAIDHDVITPENYKKRLAYLTPETEVTLHFIRDERLKQVRCQLEAVPQHTVTLQPIANAMTEFQAWLWK